MIKILSSLKTKILSINMMGNIFLNRPPVVINSIPKSGTHLLAKIVENSCKNRNFSGYALQNAFDFNVGKIMNVDSKSLFDSEFVLQDHSCTRTFGSFWLSQVSENLAIELFSVLKHCCLETPSASHCH